MAERLIPGTRIPYRGNSGVFSMFKPLIRATNGLTLGQVCAITGLEYSTVQNWIKRGFVAHPVRKKYYDRHLARILLITSLRDSMKIDSIGELMAKVNGDTDDESDDIISEERMYEYLCRAVAGIDGRLPEVSEVPELVKNVTADYDPPDGEAAVRINDALTVMVYAYISGMYRKQAENCFQNMKDGSREEQMAM